MATYLITVCDPHFTDNKPRTRRDPDYKQTQLNKLNEIIKLANGIKGQGAAAVLWAGDLFHQHDGSKIPRRLDTRIAEIFREANCPHLAIPGNHDMERARIDSLRNHPYGVLTSTGVITDVSWPNYQIVGTDPPVLVVGYPYTIEGPAKWLAHLRESKALYHIREVESARLGKPVQVAAMTHCFWGPEDTKIFHDDVIGHNQLTGTGLDSMTYGHPHKWEGVHWVPGDREGHMLSIAGPGALTRGTIAEHDTSRKPCVMVHIFHSDKNHETLPVPITHEPAEVVFDLKEYQRQKLEKATMSNFVKQLQQLETKESNPTEVLCEIREKGEIEPEVISLVEEFLAGADL